MATKYVNWLIFGALTGLILGLVAPWIISQLVSTTGIAGITFATYNVREQLTAIASTGNPIASWAAGFVGVTIPDMWWVTALVSALGLGAAVALIAWLWDKIKLGSKFKLMGVLILAHVIVGIALQNQYPAFEIISMLFLLATGILSVFIMQGIYKLTKMQLPN